MLLLGKEVLWHLQPKSQPRCLDLFGPRCAVKLLNICLSRQAQYLKCKVVKILLKMGEQNELHAILGSSWDPFLGVAKD